MIISGPTLNRVAMGDLGQDEALVENGGQGLVCEGEDESPVALVQVVSG